MTDITKITTAVSPLEEVDKINEVIQRANENTSAIALLEGAPTGSVMPYAGATAPAGWLICDGSAISRTTYADLFAVIGTTYGTGDGSTTFNLPTLVNSVPIMFDNLTDHPLGITYDGYVPNIIGEFNGGMGSGSGAFYDISSAGNGYYNTQKQNRRFGFDASRSNSTYGRNSSEYGGFVIPRSLNMKFAIKY